MLVALVSDSHDHLDRIAQAVKLIRGRGAEAVFHAGDWVAPFAAKAWREAGVPVMGVFGNNDGEKVGLNNVLQDIHQAPHLFEAAGRRILLAHDLAEVADAQAQQADLIVVGHTHNSTVGRHGRAVLVNPGEVCGWATGRASMAFVELEELNVEPVEL